MTTRSMTNGLMACGLLLMLSGQAKASDEPDTSTPPPPGTKYHFGAMTMLVTRARGVTKTVADDTMTGYPFGVLVMRGRVMFDAELMPMVQKNPCAST